MQFGYSIKSIRKKSNLSQSELAKKCGISQTSLSLIENGVKKPGKRTLKKICEAFDIPESVIYIIAMEETDMPESKSGIYKLIYPAIVNLALEMVNVETSDEVVLKNKP